MTKIEWTNETWNPIIGCTKLSEGCQDCYAEKMAVRLAAMSIKQNMPYLNGYPEVIFGRKWSGKTVFRENQLTKPLSWKKPRKIFVCSMGDLFHESVPFEWINKVFNTFGMCPEHTFQILTKRPDRMKKYFESSFFKTQAAILTECHGRNAQIPFHNLWIGVSAENQEQANKRIPILLQIPAAVRFVSCEPLINYVRLTRFLTDLNWVITGGESGPKARPMHPDWVLSLRDQCQAANVPFFFKQWGEWIDFKHFDGNKASDFGWVDKTQPAALSSFANYENKKMVFKVGKKKAGSLLDGKEYKQFPHPHSHSHPDPDNYRDVEGSPQTQNQDNLKRSIRGNVLVDQSDHEYSDVKPNN